MKFWKSVNFIALWRDIVENVPKSVLEKFEEYVFQDFECRNFLSLGGHYAVHIKTEFMVFISDTIDEFCRFLWEYADTCGTILLLYHLISVSWENISLITVHEVLDNLSFGITKIHFCLKCQKADIWFWRMEWFCISACTVFRHIHVQAPNTRLSKVSPKCTFLASKNRVIMYIPL